MEQTYRTEMRQVLDALFDNGKMSNKSVFAFGHCNATEEMLDYLSARGISITAILDNNVAKLGMSYHSAQVVLPFHIQGYDKNNSLVLIATHFYAQMAEQLRHLGYDGEVIKVVDYDSFTEYSLSDETFVRKTARVKRGVVTFKRLRGRYPSKHLVVCPYNAIGDVYWAMAFLPAYLETNGIGDAVIVTTGDGCRQVADMFKQNVVALDRVEMDEFVQALIFMGEDNHIIAHHDRPYTDNIIKYLDKHFLSFVDYYRCGVYGLPRGTEPVAPIFRLPFKNTEGLKKGKSVIIAPYAKSVIRPPQSFWETIVNYYSGQGQTVFTNIVGTEQPIVGTIPVTLPLNRMISAAEYAGYFVGLRSGLCDILYTARCSKTVIFPDCVYSTSPHRIKDFSTLPGWEEIIFRSKT